MADDVTLSCSNTQITPSRQYALINIHVANIPKVVWDSRVGLAVRRQAGKLKDLGSIPFRLSFLFFLAFMLLTSTEAG